MSHEYYMQLQEEYELTPFREYFVMPKEEQKAYLDEIREWLTDIIDEGEGIELECGVTLPVLREVPQNTESVYLTVKWKDRIVYAVREFA